MTLKEFVNQVLDISEIFLAKGDHENYRRCIELIADAMYEKYETMQEITVAKNEITEA